MIPKIILVSTVVLSAGCASHRPSLNQYQWATYGPGDTALGDPGHSSMPEARVVIPKSQPHYMLAFEKPDTNCLEIEHKVGSAINEYACPQTEVNLTAKAPCDETLWVHIYHPVRLHVKQACISVTGTVVDATSGKQKDGCRHEADGDGHCWVRLDKGQEGLLADGNIVRQGGNLVFEPICRYKVTQEDALSACRQWTQKLDLLPIGSHVRITGAYVFDAQHKHNEIHPISSIELLP